MLHFLEPLRLEFGSLAQVAAAYSAEKAAGGVSVVACVDPLLFEALGVTSLGHKLMLAKGVAALVARLDPEAADWPEPGPTAVPQTAVKPAKPKQMPSQAPQVPAPQIPRLRPWVPTSRVPTARPMPTMRGSVGAVPMPTLVSLAQRAGAAAAGTPAAAPQPLVREPRPIVRPIVPVLKEPRQINLPLRPKQPRGPPPPHVLARAAINRIVDGQGSHPSH